jgi:WD repeat-containing protein 45
MNFASSTKNDLTFASMNQTNDCIVFGTNTGFYVYTVNPLKKIIARKIPGGVSIVKMLYKSNIFVFIGNVEKGLYPNKKLIIWDDHKRVVIGEIIFKKKILNIMITREIIVVITNIKIYVYNFKDLSLIKSIETVNNPKGLCSINDQSLIAYLGDNIGEIKISLYNDDYLQVINAHRNPIELFNFSKDGKYIITCSNKGTLIRIYDTKSGSLFKELRRGSDQVQIIDLKISDDNKFLLASSSRGTIHVFSVDNENKKANEKNVEITKKNIGIGWGINSLKSFLPEYFSSEWSFSQIRINNVLTYSNFINGINEVITIGDNGCFYVLNFDKDNGTIQKNYKFISDEDDPFNNRTSTIK